MVRGKLTSVAFQQSYDVKQELKAYRTISSEEKTVVFHFRLKKLKFLYDSPPILHERHSLVVWPLSGDCLLFGDMDQNAFFEQKISIAGSKKSKQRITHSLSYYFVNHSSSLIMILRPHRLRQSILLSVWHGATHGQHRRRRGAASQGTGAQRQGGKVSKASFMPLSSCPSSQTPCRSANAHSA